MKSSNAHEVSSSNPQGGAHNIIKTANGSFRHSTPYRLRPSTTISIDLTLATYTHNNIYVHIDTLRTFRFPRPSKTRLISASRPAASLSYTSRTSPALIISDIMLFIAPNDVFHILGKTCSENRQTIPHASGQNLRRRSK